MENRQSFLEEQLNNCPHSLHPIQLRQIELRLNHRVTLKLTLENEEGLGFFDVFGTQERVQATLENSNRNKIRSTDRVRPEDEDEFKGRLNPGSYLIQITGRSENDVEYELKLKATNQNDDDDDIEVQFEN